MSTQTVCVRLMNALSGVSIQQRTQRTQRMQET